jgi:hypothetical protein
MKFDLPSSMERFALNQVTSSTPEKFKKDNSTLPPYRHPRGEY